MKDFLKKDITLLTTYLLADVCIALVTGGAFLLILHTVSEL